MFVYAFPQDVPGYLLDKMVYGRYKINQPAELQVLMRVIRHNLPSNCTCKEAAWSHWQVLLNGDVLCDIWPTVIKFRFPHGIGMGMRKTTQSSNVRNFLSSLGHLIVDQCALKAERRDERNYHAESARQETPTESPALPDDGKPPVIGPMPAPPPVTKPAAIQPRRQPCHGKLELVLDGEELRVIIAEGTYCSSFRLNNADARVLLANAAACQAQLDEPNPTTDEGQPDE